MEFKKFNKAVMGVTLGFGVALFSLSVTAYEVEASTGFVQNSYSDSSPYGFTWSSTNGQPLNSTDSTQGMFYFNYDFTSGSDLVKGLGQPTTYNGTVKIDVFSANVRADKNVALLPPSYGVFSGEFMREPTNQFFSQPVNLHYWYINTTDSSNDIPIYDTLQEGVNSQQNTLGQEEGFTVNPNGASGFLAPTSVD